VKKIRIIILHVLFATLGSILVGLVFYHLAVFQPRYAAFQFVVLGASIGLLLGCARFLPPRAFLVVPVVVWVLNSLVARSRTGRLLLRDAVFVLGLSAAAYGAERIAARARIAESELNRATLKILVLLLGYFAAGMILCLVSGARSLGMYASIYSQMGLLLAIGSVMGIELGETITKQTGESVV
jgi:hypothetical protein